MSVCSVYFVTNDLCWPSKSSLHSFIAFVHLQRPHCINFLCRPSKTSLHSLPLLTYKILIAFLVFVDLQNPHCIHCPCWRSKASLHSLSLWTFKDVVVVPRWIRRNSRISEATRNKRLTLYYDACCPIQLLCFDNFYTVTPSELL